MPFESTAKASINQNLSESLLPKHMDKFFCEFLSKFHIGQPTSLQMHFSCRQLASLSFWPQNTRIISATHIFPKKIPHEFLRRQGHQKPLHQIKLNKLCPVTADQLGCALFEKRPTFDFSRSQQLCVAIYLKNKNLHGAATRNESEQRDIIYNVRRSAQLDRLQLNEMQSGAPRKSNARVWACVCVCSTRMSEWDGSLAKWSGEGAHVAAQ